MFATATKTGGFHWVDGVGHFFSSLAAAFEGAQAANRVYRQYARLSDSQLAARGLTRDDVSRMTLKALDSGLNA